MRFFNKTKDGGKDSIEDAKANWEGGELLEKVIIRDDTQNEIYGEPVFHSL